MHFCHVLFSFSYGLYVGCENSSENYLTCVCWRWHSWWWGWWWWIGCLGRKWWSCYWRYTNSFCPEWRSDRVWCWESEFMLFEHYITLYTSHHKEAYSCSHYLTLPYLSGKACYRLALRPPVGPMCIHELTVRLLKPLGVFSRLQEWAPVFLS